MKRFVAFLAFLPIVPIFCAVAAVFWVYRIILSLYLRWQHGDQFVGMLEGRDAMWGLEEEKNCGVVNIVAYAESSIVNEVQCLPQHLRQAFLDRFEDVIASKEHRFRKGFLKRNYAFGYFYWTKDLNIELQDHIRLFEPNNSEAYVTECELREFASRVTAKNLSVDHCALWEILISTKPMLSEPRTFQKYPIFLRFHHSIGDGVAILRFLIEEIVSPSNELWTFSPKIPGNPKPINSPSTWLRAIYECPLHLINTLCMKPDPNSLNRKDSTAHKSVSWLKEEDISPKSHWLPLMEKVQTNQLGVAYSSVFITALSGTLQKYFESRDEHPKQITIAVPVRVKHEEPILKLENAFTTPMLKLPIEKGVQLADPDKHSKLINSLIRMKQVTTAMRSPTNILVIYIIKPIFLHLLIISFLPQINYLTVIILASTFPVPILECLSNMFRITASVSVMAILRENLRIGPFVLKDLIFWPPSFGTVGMNFAMFVYGNQLQLSVLADRSVLPTLNEATELLQEILHEIKRMDVTLGK